MAHSARRDALGGLVVYLRYRTADHDTAGPLAEFGGGRDKVEDR